MGKYIKRGAEKLILERLKVGFIIGLLGARQTGKTTLMGRLSQYFQDEGIPPEQIFSFNLDDVILRNEISRDFYFIRNNIEQRLGKNLKDLAGPIVLLIDEAQKVPDVFELVKILHDNWAEKIKIILSGSASLEIQKKSAESLAGRISFIYLYPLSVREILEERFSLKREEGFFEKLTSGKINFSFLKKLSTKIGADFNQRREMELLLKTIILDGTLPAVCQRPKEKELIFKSLVETYLEKDIRSIGEVGNLDDFSRLVMVLSFELGGILNISALARDLGMAVNTVKKYLSILKASFVLNTLPPVFTRPRRRFVKNQKIYFFDVGLANFLTKRFFWENVQGKIAGFLLENILIKSFEAYNKNKPSSAGVSFWRDYQGHEVDLVIEKSEKEKIPIEITIGQKVEKKKIRNLVYFFQAFKEANFGLVIYRGELKEIEIEKKKVFCLPWWLWW